MKLLKLAALAAITAGALALPAMPAAAQHGRDWHNHGHRVCHWVGHGRWRHQECHWRR